MPGNLMTGEGWGRRQGEGGKDPNYTTASKPGPLYTLNTLSGTALLQE
jgi:hypothetical protein